MQDDALAEEVGLEDELAGVMEGPSGDDVRPGTSIGERGIPAALAGRCAQVIDDVIVSTPLVEPDATTEVGVADTFAEMSVSTGLVGDSVPAWAHATEVTRHLQSHSNPRVGAPTVGKWLMPPAASD